MKNLTSLRKSKAMTQKEIAKILNIAYQTYNNYENDKAIPPLDNLIKLADFFNVSIDYLVNRESEDGTIIINGSPKTKLQKQIEELTMAEQEQVEIFIKGLTSNPARKKKIG